MDTDNEDSRPFNAGEASPIPVRRSMDVLGMEQIAAIAEHLDFDTDAMMDTGIIEFVGKIAEAAITANHRVNRVADDNGMLASELAIYEERVAGHEATLGDVNEQIKTATAAIEVLKANADVSQKRLLSYGMLIAHQGVAALDAAESLRMGHLIEAKRREVGL